MKAIKEVNEEAVNSEAARQMRIISDRKSVV